MRSVREDLVPGFTRHGFHIIIDLNHSLLRNYIPEEVNVEEVAIADLEKEGTIGMANRIQTWKRSGQSTVVFLKLDPTGESRMAETKAPPPHSTPARTIKDLLPEMLQQAADSICYVANEDLVLAIKHTWLPADVYILNGKEEKEKKP